MAGKKKVNPRRVPCTMADVERAKQDAFRKAVEYSIAIMLTVLLDKFAAQDYIREIWDELQSMADSVEKGYVSVQDMQRVLRDEYGINMI